MREDSEENKPTSPVRPQENHIAILTRNDEQLDRPLHDIEVSPEFEIKKTSVVKSLNTVIEEKESEDSSSDECSSSDSDEE